jgi:hypothetical protein
MDSRAQFKSNRPEFRKINNSFIDMLLGHMAMDIERGLKMTAGMPVDKGQMKAATTHFRNSRGRFRVQINKNYAEAQEKGYMTVKEQRVVTPDNGKTFFTLKPGIYRSKNYTTPGTGAGFFKRAVATVWSARTNYVNETRRALNL